MIRLYHLIWVQYILALKTELYGINGSDKKRYAYESVWLLDQVKLLSSGINNPYNIYHNTEVELQIPTLPYKLWMNQWTHISNCSDKYRQLQFYQDYISLNTPISLHIS